MSDLRKRALQLAGHGLAVLPTVDYLKHPGATKSDREAGLSAIPGKWEAIGARATGANLWAEDLKEGLLILDCDWTEANHFEEFAKKVGLNLDELVTVRSTSGGRHFYLQCPEPVRLPQKANVTFADGGTGSIDVRARGFKQGIMLPGSKARNKQDEIAPYEALREGAEDAIFNLQWSVLTTEQQERLEEALGAPERGAAGTGEGGSQASQVFARVFEPMLPQLRDEFDTNVICAAFGYACGAMLRTSGAPEYVAADCWTSLLQVAPNSARAQFEGHARHRKSFVKSAAASIRVSQEALAVQIAEAMHPAVAAMSSAAEKESFVFFGGAVGVKLDSQGAGVFGLLRGTEYALLHEDDWDSPDLVKVTRESMFGGRAGLSWLESLLVELQMQKKAVPSGFDKNLRGLLFSSSTTDETKHRKEVRQLREAYASFDPDGWEMRKAVLTENQSGRWLWNLAPPDTNGRKSIPFVALVDDEIYVAVPPSCSLTPQTMELLGAPAGSRAGKGKKKVYYYEVPEEVKGEQAPEPV